MYKQTTLSNGVRVISHPMTDRDSVSLGLWVGVGGRFEEDRIKGAAHFLEHIVFKGTKKYSCDEIKQRIEGVGGALNAFTSEEQTCYYAKIPHKHLPATFDVLSDMVLQPTIAQKDVSKERTVIAEEIKMYHDLPQYYVMELLDALMWPDHPLGKGIAGTHETVMRMTSADLKAFHARHYNPHNIVVASCGKLSHEEVVKFTKAKLGNLKGQAKQAFVPFKETQHNPQVRFHHRKIEQMHLALGMYGFNEYQDERYVLSLLNIILGGNMSSRLFVEVREKLGLAYSVSTSMKTLQDTGMFMVRAGLDNTKLLKAVEVILKELNKIKRAGVAQSEFTRAKDYILGQLMVGLEDTMDHMLWIGEAVIARDRVRTLKDVIARMNKVTRHQVQHVAQKVLDQGKFNLALVGPITPEQENGIRRLLGVKA